MTTNGVLRSAEWRDFEKDALGWRKRLVRTLRRELVHDARAASVRLQNLTAPDLADEAIAWALENWKAKPAATSPEQWTRKQALRLLDEALDTEALAAESRADERAAESRLVAHELANEDEERTSWFDMANMARRSKLRETDPGDNDAFDGLESDPLVSSPADRLDEREMLVTVEKALLRLPERRRKAVAHRYLDGLAVEEIAYLLDIDTDTARREIATGIAELQSGLGAPPRARR